MRKKIILVHRAPVQEPRFELDVTAEELATLYSILLKIGGSPDTSPRKFADSLRERIEKYLGGYIKLMHPEYHSLSRAPHDSIYFQSDTLDNGWFAHAVELLDTIHADPLPA